MRRRRSGHAVAGALGFGWGISMMQCKEVLGIFGIELAGKRMDGGDVGYKRGR